MHPANAGCFFMQCVLALGYRLPFEILLHYAYNFDVLGDIRCLEMCALAEELGVIYF